MELSLATRAHGEHTVLEVCGGGQAPEDTASPGTLA